MQAVCGLDFGTSNSTIGVAARGQAQLVPLENGAPTLPTAIFFAADDPKAATRPLFGRAALAEYTGGSAGRLLRAIKSVLGTSLAKESTRVGHVSLPFQTIIAHVLGHLKQQAEVCTGHPLTHVVLGRPVAFVDDNPVADAAAQNVLVAAAKQVGFTHIELELEPIAAALAFEQNLTQETLALVADIGGGTADFTVMRLGPMRFNQATRTQDILATGGVHLGGTDFDHLFSMASVMPTLGLGSLYAHGRYPIPTSYYFDLTTWQRIHNVYHSKVLTEILQVQREAAAPHLLANLIHVIEQRSGHALAGQVEAAKIELSTQASTQLILPLPGAPELALAQTTFTHAIEPAVHQMLGAAHATVARAGIAPAAIQALLLTGGTCQVPLVHTALTQAFSSAQVVPGDMFGAVGLGLTLAAARKFA